jgi:DNA mismatch endonuclease (patch repair protein)
MGSNNEQIRPSGYEVTLSSPDFDLTRECFEDIGSRMDIMTTVERSLRMARIRSKNTKPELDIRHTLYRLGYRYRLHRKDLPGVPDLTFPGRKKVLFVHGCFWHAHDGCGIAHRPESRRSFWDEKFRRNKERDKDNERLLREDGWDVHIVWECEIKNRDMLIDVLSAFLGPPKDARKTTKGRYG